jgi:hypothetical protein
MLAAMAARGVGRATGGPPADAPPAVNPLAQLSVDRAQLAAAPLGMYIVRVNILEVAELAALDMSGTSDPFVVVSVGGQTQSTEVVKQVTAAQFNSVFLFELNVRHYSELELQSVQIKVMDANPFPFSDKLIGAYEMELARCVAVRSTRDACRQCAALVTRVGYALRSRVLSRGTSANTRARSRVRARGAGCTARRRTRCTAPGWRWRTRSAR